MEGDDLFIELLQNRMQPFSFQPHKEGLTTLHLWSNFSGVINCLYISPSEVDKWKKRGDTLQFVRDRIRHRGSL